MNFFLDENFPRKSIEILNGKGFQVFDIRGTEFEGEDDGNIFERAQKKEAVFLTTDRDFFHTIHFLYESHHGIIVVALSQPNGRKILQKLELALTYIEKFDIHSQCILLTDHRINLARNTKENSKRRK